MRFADAMAELERRQPEHMPEPDLDRIRALATLLADPQLTYPTIHVTGTNGKTTTARLAAGVACAHGLTTGLFTSPHLESVTERFEICGEPMAEEAFGEEFEHLLAYLRTVDEQVGPVTYFEALTALAFLSFADAPVALAVVEVGMGGTWDATNLVSGDVAVICPIGLDHPELGSTIAEVAAEKAGIIKQGKVAVVREQADEALEVIERRCDEQIATLLLEGRDWAIDDLTPAVGGQALAIRGLHARYDDILLPIYGEHAAHNAAAAVVAVEALLERALDPDSVRLSLGAATSPGRLEVAAHRPLVILDGAHNPSAARALAEIVARVLHVGASAPGPRGVRGQGSRGRRDSARPARGRGVRGRGRQRSGAAVAGGGRRDDGPGHRDRGLRDRARRVGRGRARRSRRRPHPGDGLSVHCRGRSPSTAGGFGACRAASERSPPRARREDP